MNSAFDLWRSADRTRWFLFDSGAALPPGDLALEAFDGRAGSVDARWAGLREIGEAEGREWAREALGNALATLKTRTDRRLSALRAANAAARDAPAAPETAFTPDALPALLSLVMSLPGLLRDGLSGDSGRVGDAEVRLAAIETRLNSAGIAVGDGLVGFAVRLDQLRADAYAKHR